MLLCYYSYSINIYVCGKTSVTILQDYIAWLHLSYGFKTNILDKGFELLSMKPIYMSFTKLTETEVQVYLELGDTKMIWMFIKVSFHISKVKL